MTFANASCLLSLALLLSTLSAKEMLPLVAPDGKPAVIVAPSDRSLEGAVTELQAFLKEITGKDFPVLSDAPRVDQPAIVLRLGEGPERDGGFRLRVTNSEALVESRSAEGVSFGVSELLEQLGVRWYMPGELGTVVPKEAVPRLSLQDREHLPSFESRYFGPTWDKVWERRMRFGGVYFPPAHGIKLGKGADFKSHPEFYAEIGGKRVNKQVCVSNPEVLRRAVATAREYFDTHPKERIYGIGPNDGGNFCECKDCLALDSGDWDPFSAHPSTTDRYIWFFNRFLEELDKTHPGRSVAFYAYHSYLRPPRNVTPNPRILPALAPIALCRVHGLNNPNCPERSYYKTLLQEWGKLLPRVFERGYWFNLADPGFPFSSVHRMRDEIPAAKEYGIYGWRTETINHWASELPSHYVAAKLMWDSNADVDALLEDFYQTFFGPAAAPMKDYFQTMDHALRDGDQHTGGAFAIGRMYPKAVRERAAKALRQARAAAKDSPWKDRVALIQLSFDYLQQFLASQSARDAQNWDEAWKHWQALEATREKLVSFNPPMINLKYSRSYLDRFFRLPVEQGYQRSRNGNQVVAKLSNEWDFHVDPGEVGKEIGYQQANIRGGNWQRIDAANTSWSDKGLRYYRGLAWYRQKVEIPKAWEGKRVFLWFGGVDESARVWVNGTEVGTSADSAFTPFELDATQAVRAGQENVVTVCVANKRVDELGTGGIMAPAMFYSPAKGNDAKLDNIRALRETFP